MISETIFSGKNLIVPMADVQHIEKKYEEIYEVAPIGGTVRKGTDYTKLSGVQVITDKTKWNFENDTWENAIWIGSTDNQAEEFLKAWCQYRSEIDYPDMVTEVNDGE